jgi:hypothetical protein
LINRTGGILLTPHEIAAGAKKVLGVE